MNHKRQNSLCSLERGPAPDTVPSLVQGARIFLGPHSGFGDVGDEGLGVGPVSLT
jgi:hypothetical protein